jgi:hypothetical protein
MAVSRAVITMSDIRDIRGFLRKQRGAIFRQTCLYGKITVRVRSAAALNEDGLRIAGGVICQLNAVTHPRMRPGEHQACGERCVGSWHF